MVGAVRFGLTTSCTRNKRATRLRYRRTRQTCPAEKNTKDADGRHGTESFHVRDGQQIKRAGKNHDAREKTPPCAGHKWFSPRDRKQHNGVDEVVEDGLLPDRRGSVL